MLAVILGLDALESKANPRMHSAYGAVLRQVSQSLTVASITCFIGAIMLGEVTAQTSAAQRAREEANTELQRHLKALGSASARCHPYCWRSKQESVYSGDHHAASCDCGLLGTSLLVAIQIERPPLELYVRANDLAT